jgi:hypothetical protein
MLGKMDFKPSDELSEAYDTLFVLRDHRTYWSGMPPVEGKRLVHDAHVEIVDRFIAKIEAQYNDLFDKEVTEYINKYLKA